MRGAGALGPASGGLGPEVPRFQPMGLEGGARPEGWGRRGLAHVGRAGRQCGAEID